MENVKFVYMKNIYEIKLTGNDMTINNLLNKFVYVLNIDIRQLYFIYKGKLLFLNNSKKINELNDNNLIIFVFNLCIKRYNNKKEIKNIICPECKNLSIINNSNDLFSLNNCINNHIFNDLTINLFIESQYFDESKIECDKCHNKILL